MFDFSLALFSFKASIKRSVDRMEIDLPCQRLFFRGKQLENEQTLFDYSINVNDVIQLMIRQPLVETQSENIPITERCEC